MPQVDVGFDGSPTKQMFAGPGDTLKTTYLGNCVAVVAYDTAGNGAVMRHYDTAWAWDGRELDAVSGEKASKFSPNEFVDVQNAAYDALRDQVPNAAVAYAFTLGAVWWDIDQSSPLWKTRYNLLDAMTGVFGVEPTKVAFEATWDVTGQRFI
jgi:hypothetical protein